MSDLSGRTALRLMSCAAAMAAGLASPALAQEGGDIAAAPPLPAISASGAAETASALTQPSPLGGSPAAVEDVIQPPIQQQAAAAAAATNSPAPNSSAPIPEGLAGQVLEFEADDITYDSTGDIITASGDVLIRSDEQSVRADMVQWNQRSGAITASGNVRGVDQDGNQFFADEALLDDRFAVGAMDNLLVALREGGRLAANSASRAADGSLELNTAAYSACSVVGGDGCAKRPSWRVTADRVRYDPANKRLHFDGAVLELFGARILPMPGLVVRTDGRAESGLLIPDLRFSRSNGLEANASYYWRLGPNRDLTTTGYLYTGSGPMISAQFRDLEEDGAFQVTGYLTRSQRISLTTGEAEGSQAWRGYIYANGRFQFDPNWSLTGSLRRASDRTFLRRYDISNEDRLRSNLALERIDSESYFSLSGWAVQTLRFGQDQGQVPLVMPIVDYRYRPEKKFLGGQAELQANSLALQRSDGQDTQRAFASARWDMRMINRFGQLFTLTGLARGDLYHTSDSLLTATPSYRGRDGWQSRAMALAAGEISWPLVGGLFGGLEGTQVLTPKVQLVLAPEFENLAVPNEDSRAIDLEDTNLFSLNRFPGYDRIEDGTRLTYGLDWQITMPGWKLHAAVGQSYRFSRNQTILPDGTGLSDRVSDFVGRTELRYRDFVKFTHRFRLDKDNLAVRRNEFDATIGSRRTYLELGYLRLNRDITTVEDLQDREELRLAGRLAFAKYWSVFGSGVFNLTDREEDPTLTSDGFDPLRTRLGVGYSDDCLEFGLTWRRDYIEAGDARRGDTFQIHFAIKQLGFQ